MNSNMLFVGLLFAASFLHAQDSTRYLFRPEKLHTIGFYVAPEWQYAQYAESAFAPTAGTSLMLLFNRKWAIGVTGAEIMDAEFSPSAVSPLYLRGGFGGLRVEYTPRAYKALHLSFPLVAGYGRARVDSVSTRFFGGGHHGGGPRDDFDYDFRAGNASWLVVQPGLRLEANVVRFLKIYAGADYRIAVQQTAVTGVPGNALQGVSATVGMKVGLFGIQPKIPSFLRRKKRD